MFRPILSEKSTLLEVKIVKICPILEIDLIGKLVLTIKYLFTQRKL